jgi:DNA-binding transcriptional LysR family regulator
VDGWLGVELRHLAALAAVEEERSFRGAAERLGYVQSAVSQQISQLERLVGTRLVERVRGHGPPVTLTAAGSLLLEHGNRILSQLDAAQADIRALADGGDHVLRVGVTHSVATKLLPLALIDLRARAPEFKVTVEEVQSDRRLFARVGSGELDVAFGELPIEPGPFEYVEIVVDPCLLLVASTSAAARRGAPTSLEEIAELPLVRLQGWPMMAQIEREFSQRGLQPKFVLQADANATLQALVAADLAAAILPRTSVQWGDPRVTALELGDLLPPRRMTLYWHEGRRNREALDAFVGAALRAGRAVSAPTPAAAS